MTIIGVLPSEDVVPRATVAPHLSSYPYTEAEQGNCFLAFSTLPYKYPGRGLER